MIRAAKIIAELHALCWPWLCENNEDSEPNVFMLPEVRKLLLLHCASVTRLAHCRDAAHRNAGSRILGNVSLHRVDDDSFTHVFLFSSALRKDCSSMCKHCAFPILRLLFQENGQTRSQRENPSVNSEPEVRQKISFSAMLCGEQLNAKELRALDDKQALAGLRNTSEAISRLPGQHIELGTILASLFRKILRQSPRFRELLVLLGSGQSTLEKQEGLSAELDTLLVSARECLAKVLRCSDTEPVTRATAARIFVQSC